MDENSSNDVNDVEKIPFFTIISPSDQLQYQELRRRFSSKEKRYNRNKRVETFLEIIDEIKKFCVRNNDDDWKRFLVCGICWTHDGICINTRQLRVLIGKSKSSINGALQKMGYDNIPAKGNDAAPLLKAIPFLKNKIEEERQWTIRRLPSNSKQLQNMQVSINNHHSCCSMNDCSKDQATTDKSIIRKPCAFGCTCGCDCKINGEAEHPCTCIYPDESYEYGKDVCHCEKIAGFGQIQPIIYDESL